MENDEDATQKSDGKNDHRELKNEEDMRKNAPPRLCFKVWLAYEFICHDQINVNT